MKKLILILTLFTFFACNDTTSEELQVESPESTIPGYQETLIAHYEAGYHIGTADADMIVTQTWTNEECYALEFESKEVEVSVVYWINGWPAHTTFTTNEISVKWNDESYACPMTSTAQLLGFQQFVGIGPYSGYVQALEAKVASSILYEKAFYEGILAGFNNRLCGLSMTMPFNYTNCDAHDVPNTPLDRVHGGPSGGGPVPVGES
jgi:hypothetical protein